MSPFLTLSSWDRDGRPGREMAVSLARRLPSGLVVLKAVADIDVERGELLSGKVNAVQNFG
jgi:hypothetical protein